MLLRLQCYFQVCLQQHLLQHLSCRNLSHLHWRYLCCLRSHLSDLLWFGNGLHFLRNHLLLQQHLSHHLSNWILRLNYPAVLNLLRLFECCLHQSTKLLNHFLHPKLQTSHHSAVQPKRNNKQEHQRDTADQPATQAKAFVGLELKDAVYWHYCKQWHYLHILDTEQRYYKVIPAGGCEFDQSYLLSHHQRSSISHFYCHWSFFAKRAIFAHHCCSGILSAF